MAFAGMNYLAVLIAAVAGYAVGAVWYTALSAHWVRALGTTKAEIRARSRGARAATPFVLSAVACIVMAFVLAGAIGHLGPGQVTLWNGIVSGAILWAGFVGTTVTVNNAFAGRRTALTVIDAGHWLAVMVVMGGVIGAFGV